ncbi:hypothetical protein [Acidovorax lacteus]|uniref:EF-hand domain-containing protein n=1 Tax=Acidovorax lacteus TaxID=1924988 RepID=A0ABP8KV11_9BURK
MSLPTPTVQFPEAQVGEWTAIDTTTAPGLFAYRQTQAVALLELPDYGGGDLDAEQRREALRSAVSLHKPLAALSLFLGVVALEDLVRDLAARLADLPGLTQFFPELPKLRAQAVNRPADQAFKRLDTDPAGVLDPEEINGRFMKAMGVAPVPAGEYWHLRDLALLRHTVAHHAAVIRAVDVPRFAHFIILPGRVINPPPDFVRSELMYLYELGRTIEKAVQSAALSPIIQAAGAGWSMHPPKVLIELIELFGFFGFIETTTLPVGYSEPGSDLRQRQEAEANRIRDVLLQRCIAELVTVYGN